MSAHVFGPWTFVEGEYKDEDGAPCGAYVAVLDFDNETIVWSNEDGEHDADKFRLIAAAPALLRSLRAFVDVNFTYFNGKVVGNDSRLTRDDVDRARAAIKQATGETL